MNANANDIDIILDSHFIKKLILLNYSLYSRVFNLFSGKKKENSQLRNERSDGQFIKVIRDNVHTFLKSKILICYFEYV